MAGRVRLRIAGYEAPSARGYVRHLVGSDTGAAADAPIEYIGMVPRADLLAEAARAHVGLSLMPFNSDDLNMNHMVGASNKPFDYMAAGLALLVSDLPDWTRMFVEPGFARAADPTSAIPFRRRWTGLWINRTSAKNGRTRPGKIEAAWNYETVFAPILRRCPMLDRRLAFHLARLFLRAIPEVPGKLRIARFALRLFRKMKSVRMPD